MSNDQLSIKAHNFIKELKELCIKHNVQLSVSDYDALQVWDLEEGDEPIWCNGIQDITSSC
jgi:hypothetical protein